jgi:hypothetical protein
MNVERYTYYNGRFQMWNEMLTKLNEEGINLSDNTYETEIYRKVKAQVEYNKKKALEYSNNTSFK